ncbi:MAG: hypothetical protein Q9224_006183 [Gallowayella concinna]
MANDVRNHQSMADFQHHESNEATGVISGVPGPEKHIQQAEQGPMHPFPDSATSDGQCQAPVGINPALLLSQPEPFLLGPIAPFISNPWSIAGDKDETPSQNFDFQEGYMPVAPVDDGTWTGDLAKCPGVQYRWVNSPWSSGGRELSHQDFEAPLGMDAGIATGDPFDNSFESGYGTVTGNQFQDLGRQFGLVDSTTSNDGIGRVGEDIDQFCVTRAEMTAGDYGMDGTVMRANTFQDFPAYLDPGSCALGENIEDENASPDRDPQNNFVIMSNAIPRGADPLQEFFAELEPTSSTPWSDDTVDRYSPD